MIEQSQDKKKAIITAIEYLREAFINHPKERNCIINLVGKIEAYAFMLLPNNLSKPKDKWLVMRKHETWEVRKGNKTILKQEIKEKYIDFINRITKHYEHTHTTKRHIQIYGND